MFNLQPGQGLGFHSGKVLVWGLGKLLLGRLLEIMGRTIQFMGIVSHLFESLTAVSKHREAISTVSATVSGLGIITRSYSQFNITSKLTEGT